MLSPKLATSFLVAASLLVAGCSGNSSAVECSSVLLIDLDISTSVTAELEGLSVAIDEVLWEITGNGMPPMTGAIDTSDPNATPSVEVFGLDPGQYLIELQATSEDEQTTCRGSAMFDVSAGVATEVAVLLRCKTGQRFGGVRVNGKFNICPELVKAVVAPLQTSVGNAIIVSSAAEDAEDDTIEYVWTADGGTLADPSAPATFYNCEEVGDHVITISVTDDGGAYCIDSWSVDVRCIDGGGTGGTGGSGATGGSGGAGGSGATGGSGGAGGSGGSGATGGSGGAGGSGATGGAGGSGGSGATGGSGGAGGSGATGGAGGSGATGGSGGAGGSGAAGGSGGAGGSGATGGSGGAGGSGATGGAGGSGATAGAGGIGGTGGAGGGGMCEIIVTLTES